MSSTTFARGDEYHHQPLQEYGCFGGLLGPPRLQPQGSWLHLEHVDALKDGVSFVWSCEARYVGPLVLHTVSVEWTRPHLVHCMSEYVDAFVFVVVSLSYELERTLVRFRYFLGTRSLLVNC